MKTNIGLWIDHRRAVIILGSEIADTKVINSNTDKQPGRIDGERSTEKYEALLVPADDVTERKFHQSLNAYYDEVIDCVHGAKQLLIFGPGEAKGELKKRLEHTKASSTRHVSVETTDKLTDHQVAAKVREHFAHVPPTIYSK